MKGKSGKPNREEIKPKRCTQCGKILRINNKSFLCQYHANYIWVKNKRNEK